MWLPSEGGADGETACPPPPEVGTERALQTRGVLLPLARRAMGAVTLWVSRCSQFLRKEDGDEFAPLLDLEVTDRFLPCI